MEPQLLSNLEPNRTLLRRIKRRHKVGRQKGFKTRSKGRVGSARPFSCASPVDLWQDELNPSEELWESRVLHRVNEKVTDAHELGPTDNGVSRRDWCSRREFPQSADAGRI